MSEARKANTAPVWALLCALGGVGCTFAVFLGPPLQEALPWLSLLLAGSAVLLLLVGLRRSFGQPEIYRGKALSVVLAIVTLVPAGLTGFAFFGARKLPAATGAPQIGQRVPDFTLSDTSGKPVSLDQLFAATPESPAPKSVLLIFYRGYW